MLSSLVLAASIVSFATAQTPLAAKRFDYNNLPYQADTDGGVRGHQVGYNRCNATTEGPQSMCQTAIINSIDDFCLWGPPEPNSIVGNTEGEMVAWCTKPGHGTRLIPSGALQGVQFVKTPHYVQVVGFINQPLVNIQADDYGGEMDSAGADGRGNPLGGLFFTNAFGGGNGSSYVQTVRYHNFMGGSQFCLKACDPSWGNDYRMCEHIYDRIGCKYNAPANYAAINGTFQSCLSDDQLYPGVYVGGNGVTSTYTQPPESLGAIQTIPYEPFTPASSQCTPYTSAAIYAALPTVTMSTSSSIATTSSMPTSSTSASSGSTPAVTSAPTSAATRVIASGATGSTPSTVAGTSGASALPISGIASSLLIASLLVAFSS